MEMLTFFREQLDDGSLQRCDIERQRSIFQFDRDIDAAKLWQPA